MGHWTDNHIDYYVGAMEAEELSPVLYKLKRKSILTANKSGVTTLVFRGKLQYARVLGDPVLNYNKDGQEWKFDFIPNDPEGAAAELKSAGVRDRLRVLYNKGEDGEPDKNNPKYDGREYMSFKQNATKRDGTPNVPIRVEDVYGNAWPEDVLLGNDTVVDVRFVVIDNGRGKFHGVYPRSIRVLELVPYQSKEFDAIAESDPYFQKAAEAAREVAMLKGVAPKAPASVDEDQLNDEIPV